MTALDLMERTHALLQAGGQIYAARQTGLYRVGEAGADINLYEGWLPGETTPTLAIAVDSATGITLTGINGGVARSTDGGGELGSDSISRAGAAGDLPGASL